jgi:hypothetical protein
MKRGFIISILMLLICIQLIIAQNEPPAPSVPGSEIAGEINPDTGQLKKIEEIQKSVEGFKNRQQNQSFLYKQWTTLPYVGKALSATEQFFSALNPLWRLLFQIEFSWTLFFMLCLFFLIIIFIFMYVAVETFTPFNPFILAIISGVLAFIIGISEGINQGVTLITRLFPNGWTLFVGFIAAVILVVIYIQVMKKWGYDLKEEGKKARQEMREMKEETHEEITDIKLKQEGLD